jgi:environmental stress-induced protein Ves
MPWKNGAGETAEIAISPVDAPLEKFDWRVSMARVEADGPFSVFEGIDRTLAILDGAGLTLRIAGGRFAEVTSSSAPCTFAADVATDATLIAGPITDLNVMTRRGRATHNVRRQELADPVRLEVRAQTTLVVCASGRLRVATSNGTQQLAPKDTVVLDRCDGPIVITAEQQSSAFIVELEPEPG